MRPWLGKIQTGVTPLILLGVAGGTIAEALLSRFSPQLWLAAAALATAGAAAVARRAIRTRTELQSAEQALSRRVTELAALHSISREILRSMDVSRVFATLERECRKVFDVDFFFVAAVDPGTRKLDDSLLSWVVSKKRSLRVDDFWTNPPRLPFRPHVADRRIRSVLAVPLVVEDRAIGVLSVQCRRPRAYDDHQLSVLHTIGQYAAAAMENARHFELATVDSLTGLFLRDYFFRRLEEEHGRARRYGGGFVVLMADLDGFKEVNDRHGHLAGDRYLRAIGAAIHERLRSADLACRYGGDEFCLLLPQTDSKGAQIIAERLRAAVSSLQVEMEGTRIQATMCIGLASFPHDEPGELRSLLLKADQALYQAKRAGRDRVHSFAA